MRDAVSIPVTANGGVNDAASAESLRLASGCGRIMVARGAMGNPWLFREFADPDNYRDPTAEELACEMELHIKEMKELYGTEAAFKLGRKILLDYLRGRGFPSEYRRMASLTADEDDLKRLLEAVAAGAVSPHHLTVPVLPKR